MGCASSAHRALCKGQDVANERMGPTTFRKAEQVQQKTKEDVHSAVTRAADTEISHVMGDAWTNENTIIKNGTDAITGIRQKGKEVMDDVVENLEEVGESMESKGEALIASGRETVDDFTHNVAEEVSKVGETVKDKIEEVKNKVEEMVSDVAGNKKDESQDDMDEKIDQLLENIDKTTS